MTRVERWGYWSAGLLPPCLVLAGHWVEQARADWAFWASVAYLSGWTWWAMEGQHGPPIRDRLTMRRLGYRWNFKRNQFCHQDGAQSVVRCVSGAWRHEKWREVRDTAECSKTIEVDNPVTAHVVGQIDGA